MSQTLTDALAQLKHALAAGAIDPSAYSFFAVAATRMTGSGAVAQGNDTPDAGAAAQPANPLEKTLYEALNGYTVSTDDRKDLAFELGVD